MRELPPPPMEDAAVRSLLDEAARLGELARDLQESASSLISKTWNEEQALRQRAVALESDLKKLQAESNSAIRRGAIDPKNAEKLDEELYRARCLIREGDVASLLPNKDHGKFLKMFLGPVNLRATRKEVRLKMKEEYNNYRDRTAFLFLLFPSTLLLLRSWIWDGCFPALPVQLYQAWLLFLYTSLALRENILRVNGSDIRPWWIYHHYCAMLMALVSLTWEIKGQPDCAKKHVLAHVHINLIITRSKLYELCAERSITISGMGCNARFCNASTKSLSAATIVYSYCFRKGKWPFFNIFLDIEHRMVEWSSTYQARRYYCNWSLVLFFTWCLYLHQQVMFNRVQLSIFTYKKITVEL